MYLSEIRKGEIEDLKRKVTERKYGKYLYRISLKRLRGLHDQNVTFDFPVTALIGPNGGGKTTVLGAAGLAYRDIPPRSFFVKSGNIDRSMSKWEIVYEAISKELSAETLITRNAKFVKERWWRKNVLVRNVRYFGVSRTVPATEKLEYRKFTTGEVDLDQCKSTSLKRELASAISRILGKDVSEYKYISIDRKGTVSLLSGSAGVGGDKFSEFHFGAGESSVIRMVIEIETKPENSLILIEEIENGLHPVAIRKMVEYLIDVSKRKKCQVIFTTHSNDALIPLPPEAVWATRNGKVVQGKLDIEALRVIKGEVDTKLIIFTEDSFAKDWMNSMLMNILGEAKEQIEVHPAKGDSTAVNHNKYNNESPARKIQSFCYIDGNSEQLESDINCVFRLPGDFPEDYIFRKVIDRLETDTEERDNLPISIACRNRSPDEIMDSLKQIKLANRDPHLLYDQISSNLGGLPIDAVKTAFFSIYVHSYSEEVKNLLNPILSYVQN